MVFLNITNLIAGNESILLIIAALSCFLAIILLVVSNNKNSDYNRSAIKEQLETLKPKEEIEVKSELENVLSKMELDLDKKPVIATFEEEQEEKAIISYADLVNTAKMQAISLDEVQENDYVENLSFDVNDIYDNEPIMQIEVEEKKDALLSKIDEVLTPLEKEMMPNKFKNTEFISPIYGKMEDEVTTIPLREHTYAKENVLEIDYQSISIPESSVPINTNALVTEIEVLDDINLEDNQNEEFLEKLIEFRKNLE